MAICLFLSKEKKKKLKNGFLLANSELLLEGLISSGLKSNPISIFSEKELEQASNNYHSDQLLYSDDSSYDFYKGVHQNRIILIKKFKGYYWNGRIKRCISEIVALSQINHINIMKLLGCCLETQFPIQVYEFCFDRNLSDCIQKPEATNDECRLLSWEDRLRVAIEIAYAVTYLHTANPNATIHRDIKPTNVLLDQNGVAKLFDLSYSILIPFGETHVEDVVTGTHGYVAPDCFETGRVSEKSDVYSFGMFLFGLVTGNSIFYLATLATLDHEVEEGLSVSDYVKSLIREDRLREIVEPIIWNESVDGMLMNHKQHQEFAKLAVRCTEKLEEERPTMMEVGKELRQIKSIAVSESSNWAVVTTFQPLLLPKVQTLLLG